MICIKKELREIEAAKRGLADGSTDRCIDGKGQAMPIPDAPIASYFEKIADVLEICGNNPYRIRAYRDAAASVGEFGRVFKNLPCCALPERDGSSPADIGRGSTACLRATE